MSDNGAAPVVAVHGVGKRFELGSERSSSSLRRLTRLFAPGGDKVHRPREQFWPVRHVSFELPAGHILGIMGRNGSGKTTLMKMVSRITVPTEGRIELRGRVGAMLRVGTGFHPQLSGRDNIALSGAILGMSKAEIAAVEDDIIRFAEIGRFLDMPVKHYSSGMNVRLAFGVSSHMPADIMIIDEVLSVGDQAFQRRCQERIKTLVEGGRTILFVSHNTESVRAMCDSAIVLDRGRVRYAGDPDSAVDFYEQEILKGELPDKRERRGRRARGGAATPEVGGGVATDGG